MDYATVCSRLGVDEWPNLRERIEEPDIQASIHATMAAFDTFEKTWTDENEDTRDYAGWCALVAERQLSILVDGQAYHMPMEPYPEWIRKKKYEERISDIVPFDRELPGDVLDIIRQYSKPAFLHFREYNQALALFDFPPNYKQSLREKIGDPAVREQLRICVDAHDDYHKIHAVYLHHKTSLNEELSSKAHYWADVSKNKLVSLLDGEEYYQKGYAAWYFQDDINDSWRHDSDDSSTDSEVERQRYMSQERAEEHYKQNQLVNDDIYDGLDGLVRLGRLGSAPI